MPHTFRTVCNSNCARSEHFANLTKEVSKEMSQPAGKITAARNQRIIEMVYNEGYSHAAAAAEFGLSESSVKKLIRRDRVENGERLRRSCPVNPRGTDREPISPVHAYIGQRIDRAICRPSNKMSASEFGLSMSPPMSSAKIHDLRRGVYDLSLREFLGLMETLGISFRELDARD